jgi:hypothetical protein
MTKAEELKLLGKIEEIIAEEGFNSVPMSVIDKINEHDNYLSITEITPPTIGNWVYIHTGEYCGEEGEVVGVDHNEENTLYKVRINDDPDNPVLISSDCFDVQHDMIMPICDTMWAFSDPTDIEWANGEYLGPHLQEIADCGFRIYESEDYGILLGIDHGGYSFYDEH